MKPNITWRRCPLAGTDAVSVTRHCPLGVMARGTSLGHHRYRVFHVHTI